MTNADMQRIMQNSPQMWTVSSILTYGYGNILLCDEQRACLNVTDFYYIEGPFLESFAKQLTRHLIFPAIIVSSNPEWQQYWNDKSEVHIEKVSRRMYQWVDKVEMLKPFLKMKTNTAYSVKPIGKTEAEQIQHFEWTEGVFDSYEGAAGFLKRGFGYCISDQNKIISLCMSFAHSEHGIEIEVDTDPAYQGQGLGKIVSTHFIFESLKRGMRPLWDATNIPSAKIAEAIGFEFMREYKALLIQPLD
jgi:hypothetical protein